MSKKKPFETIGNYDNTNAGSFVIEPTFWDSINVRETIESIAMAIVLAMIFKTLQAEAYIIPTGSMAPTLMGQHVEVACPDCDYYFQVGATFEGPSSRVAGQRDAGSYRVHKVRCPLTFEIRELARAESPLPKDANGQAVSPQPNDESFAGDRIVVSKLEHLWREPQRWDVIVFKYPGAAKANYIKRLVGLPGESLTINNGDVYVQPSIGLNATIAHSEAIASKPASKLAKIAIPVQDSHYFSSAMRKAGLPPSWIPDAAGQLNAAGPSWQQRCVAQSQWKVQAAGAEPATYQVAAATSQNREYDWLRFRHLVPRQAHWEAIREGQSLPSSFLDSPGHLVTDYYCYNDGMMIRDANNWDDTRFGGNWVGDLIMEAEVTVGPQGTLALDAVEGGVHFLCEIDVATGQATLSPEVSLDGVTIRFAKGTTSEPSTPASLKFATPLKGSGAYRIRYANCDDRIYLWINDQEVAIPGDGAYLRTGKLHPFYHPQDNGDARPLGIGFQGGSLSVERLKVLRDFYYLGADDFYFDSRSSVRDRNGQGVHDRLSVRKLHQYYETPSQWNSVEFREWYQPFDQQTPLNWGQAFQLSADQFFPMGDNSPQSEDARKWNAPKYVERRFMIGRALMVYWPHTWNAPPFWPNFNRMRVIH